MYRSVVQTAVRPVARSTIRVASRAPRRFASTSSPADKPRTWKGSMLRWGLVGGAVYYYFSSPVFAEQPTSRIMPPPSSFAETDLPTVESVIEEKRKQASERLEKARDKPAPSEPKKPEEPVKDKEQSTAAAEGSPAQLGEEADQQGAFNPETGEINWDCPCLGGMAHGPCGEDFKTAFSCFVYSNEEPKGMDCIEKFQGMQECFRKYPEIYGAELADEEEAAAADDAAVAAEGAAEPQATEYQQLREEPRELAPSDSAAKTIPTEATSALPKYEDATEANEKVEKNTSEKKD